MAIDFSAWEGYRVIWLRRGNGLEQDLCEQGASPAWTAALEQHCRWQGMRLAGVCLQPDDDDPGRFVQAVEQAIDRALEVQPQPGSSLAQAEPESSWVALINRISAHARPVFLALVGYDQIQHTHIHALVAELLEFQPATLHILLDCQSSPPLPLPRLRARRELLEVAA